MVGLREHCSKRDGTTIASLTVRNVASAVRVFFADAYERKVTRRSSTAGWNAERHLPAIEDKQRGWRERAGVSLETKTGATLHIPIHSVLQGMLEAWWDEGWARYMGRAPQSDDLIFPRDDGKQRLVSGSCKKFKQDLVVLGLAAQRQYESRSTFRNLTLSAGATEFHVNLITHPKPKRASDYYTRLEMQWPGMCEAVVAIDAGAWPTGPLALRQAQGERNLGALGDAFRDEVTVEGTTNEKPPTLLENVGG